MTAGIRELFPFGDVDASVPRRMAERFPEVPVDDLAAALELGVAVVSMLEILSAPLDEAGLSPARWRLLVALVAQAGPEGESIGVLAGRLGVREPTMTATVDRAERDGLVARRRSPSDGRIVVVQLTERGRRTFAGMVPQVAGRLSTFVGALGGADAARATADRLSAAVAPVREAQSPRS